MLKYDIILTSALEFWCSCKVIFNSSQSLAFTITLMIKKHMLKLKKQTLLQKKCKNCP